VSSSTRLVLASNAVLQALGEDEGGVVLRLDTGEMYTVNDTTLAFLRELDGKRTVADVARSLVEIFDVEEAALAADLAEIADDLIDDSLVVAAL
jgi:hypothetical protein